MLIYLDTAIVIYAIEGAPAFKTRAVARLASANAARDDIASSDLTRLECWVQPLRNNDPTLQADYSQFLDKTKLLAMSPTVFDRAATIRANHNYGVVDSLHLAAAIIGNCGLFLTNDARLRGFPDIKIEMLP